MFSYFSKKQYACIRVHTHKHAFMYHRARTREGKQQNKKKHNIRDSSYGAQFGESRGARRAVKLQLTGHFGQSVVRTYV